jgi:hypothetical protein
MIFSPTNTTPPPALTWTHLFPSSAIFNCPEKPDWFRQRPAGPPDEPAPRVEVLWSDAAAVMERAGSCDGIVAFNCRNFPKDRLHAAGYVYLRHFAVLPSMENARWFVPLDSPVISSGAMSMYTPARTSARLKRAALRLAMQTRLPFWYRDHVWIAQRQMPPLERALQPLFPTQVVRLALSSGAPEGARNRKASGVIMGRDGKKLAFVKMARSAVARRIIEREAVVLKHLAGLPNVAVRAPRLLLSEEADGVALLAQAPLEGSPAPIGITQAHREFLAGMQTPLTVQAALTATAADLPERFGALPVSRPDLLEICQRVLAALREFDVPLTIVHGDFAPWNLRLHDGRISAFDWEYGEPHGLPLMDEIHYRLQTGWLLEHWGTPQAVAWLEQFAWTHPLGLNPRQVTAIAITYLLDALARLLGEGYEDQDEIIVWHRRILDRLTPQSATRPGAAA